MSANDILASMGSYEEANIKSMKLAPALDTISITSVDERQVLKDLHEQLVDALPPHDVAPKMYSKDLITDKELEEFQAASTKSEKNTVLLDSMKRRQRGFLRTFINDVVSVIPGQGHISDALKTAWQKFADGNPKRRSTTTTPAQERTRPANSTPSSQVHTRVPQRRTGPFPCRAPPPQKSNDNRQDFFAMRDQIQSLKQELQESNDKLHAQEQYTDQLKEAVLQRDEEWKTELEVNDEEWRAKLQKNDEHWRKKYEDLKVRNRRKIEELKRDYQAHLQAETSKQLNSFKRRLESLTRKQEASLNELGRQKEYVEKKITECSSVPQSRSWLYDESQSSADDDDETWSSEPPEYEVDHGHHYSSSYSLDQSDREYAIDSRFPERKSPDHLTRTHKYHRSTDHLNRDRDSSVDKFETASLRHFSPTERPSTTFTQPPQQPHHHRSFGRQSNSRRNYNDQGSHKHRGRASNNKSSLRNSISNIGGSIKNFFWIGSKQTTETASSYQRHNSPRTGRGSGGGGGGSRHATVITQQPQRSYMHYDSSVDSDAYASAREDFTDDEDFGFGPVGRSRQLEYERQPKEDREFTRDTPKVPAHMRPTPATSSTTKHTQNKTRQAPKESGTKSEVPKPSGNTRQTTTATPPSTQEKKSPTKSSSIASSSQANTHQQQNNPKPKRETASVVKKSKIQHQFTPQFNKDKTAPNQPVDDGTSTEGTTIEHKEKSKSRSWNPFNKSSKK